MSHLIICSNATDDLIQIESDLGRLDTLMSVIVDMTDDMKLSPGAAPIDHAALDIRRDMLRIAGDLLHRISGDMKKANELLLQEQGQAGGQGND